MNESQINGRLAWLSSNLAAQRNNLAKILLRLKGIGLRAGTSLGLHRKFMGLLEQIAADREKEIDIINEIEAVEKQHSEMRQRKLLRYADPDLAPQTDIFVEEQREDEPKRISLLTLFGLIYLFSSKPINHKNQDLTVD